MNNCTSKEKKWWKIRKLAVKQYFKLTDKQKPKWKEHHLYNIYFGTHPDFKGPGNDTLNFISKALVDPMFNTFAHKLPSILKFYSIS